MPLHDFTGYTHNSVIRGLAASGVDTLAGADPFSHVALLDDFATFDAFAVSLHRYR
jgi:hypothetical protein